MFYKIIDEKTKRIQVGLGTDKEFFESLGMQECTPEEIERSFNGVWYLKGYAPTQTADQKNKEVQIARSRLYTSESDPLFMKYQEALARGDANAEELKQTWLLSKDKIRKQNPYKK